MQRFAVNRLVPLVASRSLFAQASRSEVTPDEQANLRYAAQEAAKRTPQILRETEERVDAASRENAEEQRAEMEDFKRQVAEARRGVERVGKDSDAFKESHKMVEETLLKHREQPCDAGQHKMETVKDGMANAKEF